LKPSEQDTECAGGAFA